MNIAGIDIGLTLIRPTSGICRTGEAGEALTHTFIDGISRAKALAPKMMYDVVAIDGPVLRKGRLHYDVRSCEKVLLWGGLRANDLIGIRNYPKMFKLKERSEQLGSIEGSYLGMETMTFPNDFPKSELYEESFVAFLDILGFTDRVRQIKNLTDFGRAARILYVLKKGSDLVEQC